MNTSPFTQFKSILESSHLHKFLWGQIKSHDIQPNLEFCIIYSILAGLWPVLQELGGDWEVLKTYTFTNFVIKAQVLWKWLPEWHSVSHPNIEKTTLLLSSMCISTPTLFHNKNMWHIGWLLSFLLHNLIIRCIEPRGWGDVKNNEMITLWFWGWG